MGVGSPAPSLWLMRGQSGNQFGEPRFPYIFHTTNKKRHLKCRKLLNLLVGAIGLEPTTPTMSRAKSRLEASVGGSITGLNTGSKPGQSHYFLALNSGD